MRIIPIKNFKYNGILNEKIFSEFINKYFDYYKNTNNYSINSLTYLFEYRKYLDIEKLKAMFIDSIEHSNLYITGNSVYELFKDGVNINEMNQYPKFKQFFLKNLHEMNLHQYQNVIGDFDELNRYTTNLGILFTAAKSIDDLKKINIDYSYDLDIASIDEINKFNFLIDVTDGAISYSNKFKINDNFSYFIETVLSTFDNSNDYNKLFYMIIRSDNNVSEIFNNSWLEWNILSEKTLYDLFNKHANDFTNEQQTFLISKLPKEKQYSFIKYYDLNKRLELLNNYHYNYYNKAIYEGPHQLSLEEKQAVFLKYLIENDDKDYIAPYDSKIMYLLELCDFNIDSYDQALDIYGNAIDALLYLTNLDGIYAEINQTINLLSLTSFHDIYQTIIQSKNLNFSNSDIANINLT